MSPKLEVVKLKEPLLQAKHTQSSQYLLKDFSKNLRDKDSRYLFEKHLRDDQLATVLRALLLMEAKLRREQKRIANQLSKKDFIIQKQQEDIKKILYSQYCMNCSRLYNPGFHLDSSDFKTNSQERSFGTFISGDDVITTSCGEDVGSNTNYILNDSSCDEVVVRDSEVEYDYHINRTESPVLRKTFDRENFDAGFGIVKVRTNNDSPFSNEENTSDDYGNFDSLPTESSGDQFSEKSLDSGKAYRHESLEKVYNHHNIDSLSDSNITVIHNIPTHNAEISEIVENQYESDENKEYCPEEKLPKSALIFEMEGESNEKWYVSASDQEDEQQKNIYRNNPVLECVNQILLQNIDTDYDSLNSPTASTDVDNEVTRTKIDKIDFEQLSSNKEHRCSEMNLKDHNDVINDYYETPIHKVPNFYETPESIYSNDYEQIRSKCSEIPLKVPLERHDQEDNMKQRSDFTKKYKTLKTPPTLPPKPVNLLSKYRIQYNSSKFLGEKVTDRSRLESEPDYCSISELNLPTNRVITSGNSQVIAEINAIDIPSRESVESLNLNYYDFVKSEGSDMATENMNQTDIQLSHNSSSAKSSNDTTKSYTSLSNNIPKLPSVSEIIIPEDTDKKVISQYNYTKKFPQLPKTILTSSSRKPIKIGSSVSALIMGFNNKELMYEINKRSFKTSCQNEIKSEQSSDRIESETNNEDCFIQNFEEFKLDDCELQEYDEKTTDRISECEIETTDLGIDHKVNTFRNTIELRTLAEEVADINLNSQSLKDFIKRLKKCKSRTKQLMKDMQSYDWKDESTYEDFLECTGLSSKSILTSSKVNNTTNQKKV